MNVVRTSILNAFWRRSNSSTNGTHTFRPSTGPLITICGIFTFTTCLKHILYVIWGFLQGTYQGTVMMIVSLRLRVGRTNHYNRKNKKMNVLMYKYNQHTCTNKTFREIHISRGLDVLSRHLRRYTVGCFTLID